MSEKIFRFLLGEIGIVRVLCQNKQCLGIIEIPIHRLAAKFERAVCPLCGADYLLNDSENPLHAFGKAVEKLKLIDSKVKLQFPITVDEK